MNVHCPVAWTETHLTVCLPLCRSSSERRGTEFQSETPCSVDLWDELLKLLWPPHHHHLPPNLCVTHTDHPSTCQTSAQTHHECCHKRSLVNTKVKPADWLQVKFMTWQRLCWGLNVVCLNQFVVLQSVCKRYFFIVKLSSFLLTLHNHQNPHDVLREYTTCSVWWFSHMGSGDETKFYGNLFNICQNISLFHKIFNLPESQGLFCSRLKHYYYTTEWVDITFRTGASQMMDANGMYAKLVWQLLDIFPSGSGIHVPNRRLW